jgi:hypothetical protein
MLSEPAVRGKSTDSRVELVKENNLTASTLADRVPAVQSSDSSEDDWVWDRPEGDTAIEDSQVVQDVARIPSKATVPCLEERQPQTKEIDAAIKLPPNLSHYHLTTDTNIAVQNDENKQAMPEQNVQEAKANAKILSPNPISPAQQLRVSNSIPQLMKALPPLPYEAQYDDHNPCAVSSKDTEVHSNLLFASTPANTSIAVRPGGGIGGPSLEPVFGSKDLRTSSHQRIQSQPQMSQSRFKVRVRSSQSSELSSKLSTGSPKVPGRSSSSPVKPRLRLKVSRNRMSSKLMSLDDINVHNEGLRQYKSLLDLGNSPRQENSPTRSSFEEALEEQVVQLNSDKRLSNIDEGTTRGYSPKISDQFDISYPSPTKGIVMAELVPQSDLESKPDPFDRQQGDFVSRPNPKPLGYKTSGLQSNGALVAKGRQPRAMSNVHESNLATLGSDLVSDSSDESTLAPSQITVILSQRLRNKTRRVKRWVSELKRTVRKLMKRAPNRRR